MHEPITPTREPFAYQPAAPIDPFRVSPNDPPWNSGVAVGIWVVSVLLILFIPVIFLAPYAISVVRQYPSTDELIQKISTDPFAIGLQVAAIIPAHLLTILLAYLLVTQRRRYPFLETLGWKSGGMRWWHYVAILVGFFAVAGVVNYFIPAQETELTRILKSSRYAVFLIAFMATFTAPFVEEVIYRGILYSALQRTFGVGGAVAMVTFLFTLVHVPQYLDSISTLMMLCLLSLILTLIRVKTDNLLPCVILHTIFNGFQSLYLIAEPYLGVATTGDGPVSSILSLLT